MSPDRLITVVADLLRLPAEARTAIQLSPCSAGGNNRVFRVTVGERQVLLKQYFRHPSDPRDRLRTEQAFLEHAAKMAPAQVPQVIACDAANGVGIYEYIEGTKPEGAVSRELVREAAVFFSALNAPASRAAAGALPIASEACFTVAEHFGMVDRRIARLASLSGPTDSDRAARDLVARLGAAWSGLKEQLSAALSRQNIPEAIDPSDRCISPSDFGFHNALVRSNGKLCFLDFEYAGWDDPAKMVGDFFSHPAVPVPGEYLDEFVRETMSYSRRPGVLEARARLLFPVFQVKWCCIILNDFIPEFAERRRFADPGLDEAAARRRQLEKAQRLYASIAP